MGEIKSAFEKAMERIEEIEEASEEEKLKWKYIPEGKKLASGYIKEEINLSSELSKYDDKAMPFISVGAQEVLLTNIDLPASDISKRNNKKAMEGIKALKVDKAGLENIYSKIRNVFGHYEKEGEQQRRDAYEMVKQDFNMKIQQAMQQQGVPTGTKIDIEGQPQFQEEWRKVLTQLDSQYLKILGEYKQEISRLK